MDIGNSLEWDLVARGYKDGSTKKIQDENFLIDSNALRVGIRTDRGKSSWITSGWVYHYVLASPSSTGEFTSPTLIKKYVINQGNYQLLVLENFSPRPYLIRIEFPHWFPDAFFEIWKYNP